MKHNRFGGPLKLRNQTKRKIRIAAQKKPILGQAVEEQLIHFREYHPAKRFSRNLRTMLIEFLMYEGATEVNYLQDLLYDLQGLFELLDAIQIQNETEANPDS
jgi:hypothetical protein